MEVQSVRFCASQIQRLLASSAICAASTPSERRRCRAFFCSGKRASRMRWRTATRPVASYLSSRSWCCRSGIRLAMGSAMPSQAWHGGRLLGRFHHESHSTSARGRIPRAVLRVHARCPDRCTPHCGGNRRSGCSAAARGRRRGPRRRRDGPPPVRGAEGRSRVARLLAGGHSRATYGEPPSHERWQWVLRVDRCVGCTVASPMRHSGSPRRATRAAVRRGRWHRGAARPERLVRKEFSLSRRAFARTGDGRFWAARRTRIRR